MWLGCTNLGHISTIWKCQGVILSYSGDLRRLSAFSNLKRKDCFEKLESQHVRLIYEWEGPWVHAITKDIVPERTLSQTRAENRSPLGPHPFSVSFRTCLRAVLGVHPQSPLVCSIKAEEPSSQTDWHQMCELPTAFKGQKTDLPNEAWGEDWPHQALDFLSTVYSSREAFILSRDTDPFFPRVSACLLQCVCQCIQFCSYCYWVVARILVPTKHFKRVQPSWKDTTDVKGFT